MHIGYLITSCKGYEGPLGRLLWSLPSSIPSQDVAVVVAGGWERVRCTTVIRQFEVDHDSYDYTALIDFAEYPDDYPAWSHVLLLHDTMSLSAETPALLRATDPLVKATAVWSGQCNLALYRADYLRSCAAQLFTLRNCSKARSVEAEGFLWRQLPDSERAHYGGACEVESAGTPYGGSVRIREVYTGVGITKYKANWGQNMDAMAVTP